MDERTNLKIEIIGDAQKIIIEDVSYSMEWFRKASSFKMNTWFRFIRNQNHVYAEVEDECDKHLGGQLHCPNCGEIDLKLHFPYGVINESQVKCSTCNMMGPLCISEQVAIDLWNRLARRHVDV